MGRSGRRKRGGRGGRSDRRTLKRDFKEPREGVWRSKQDGNGQIVKENEKFEEYYKLQGIVPEGEWDEFMTALRRPLPVTFRINGRGRFAEALRLSIESKWGSKAQEEENENIAPKCVSWYPGGLAWSVNASRKNLRRDLELKEFHEFLSRETEDGSLSRQEAVSMIPPLFLDVKPHHKVLDMCASPGSKTFQILEMLHSDPDEPPTGLVIANDLDHVRCNLLTHQIKRMCSPNVMVTSHDASRFPNRRKADSEDKVLEFDRILCDVPCSGDGTLRKSLDIWSRWDIGNGNGLHIMQLRITLKACQLLKVGGRLVYSTCSLNPIEDEAVVAEVIRRSGGAMQLVDVSNQVPELKRTPGLKHWKVSDRNRCFDNYADVEEVRKIGGFKLAIDKTFFPDEESDKIPLHYCMRVLPHHQDTGGFFVAVLELVKRLGRIEFPSAAHRWQDCDHPSAKHQRPRNESAKEVKKDLCSPGLDDRAQDESKTNIEKTVESGSGGVEFKRTPIFDPDAPEKIPAEAESASHPETGVIEEQKDTEAPQAKIIGDANLTSEAKADGEVQADKLTSRGFRGCGDSMQIHKGVDPIIFLDDHPLVKETRDFYGINDPGFGQHLISRMLTNSKPRRVYTISHGIKELLVAGCQNFLKVHSVGHKVLQRYDDKRMDQECIYRFSQEGLSLVLKHITKRVLFVSVEDVINLLETRSLLLPKHSTDGTTAEMENETNETIPEKTIEDARLVAQLEGFVDGGAIALLRDEDAEPLGLPLSKEAKGGLTSNAPVALACCRVRSRIKLMVGKQEATLILEKLKEALSRQQASAGQLTERHGAEEPVDKGRGLKRKEESVQREEEDQSLDSLKKQRIGSETVVEDKYI